MSFKTYRASKEIYMRRIRETSNVGSVFGPRVGGWVDEWMGGHLVLCTYESNYVKDTLTNQSTRHDE